MRSFEVYKKIKDALEAVERYQSNKNDSTFEGLIETTLIELNEKRHMLANSGSVCSCCGGSGRS